MGPLALQVLFWKKQAEQELQRSGLCYTIVRPGGRASATPSMRVVAQALLCGASTEALRALLPAPHAGGLKNELRAGEAKGNVVMAGPNTYGVPPMRQAGSILRRQVAEVCAAALVEPAAVDRVVEIIAEPSAPALSMGELFGTVAGR
jgi:hypothetical protein